MNGADNQHLLQYIRRLAGEPSGTLTDGEMLRRYLENHDESAFAALVRRHGPMVFVVCQSVMRQHDDAEDAFQATFLVLAQKAASIRRQEDLGGWLHRVAYRIALKARARKVRRQIREATVIVPQSVPSMGDDLSWGEIRDILHRELAELPEQFRAPLVLCYLEGLTQEEAARQLGWTAATVKGRLQRGREKLRRRLERRGMALTAALGAALTGQAVVKTSVRAATPFTVETATKTAVALASGFLQPLVSIKIMALSAVLLSLSVVAGGVVLRSTLSEPRPLGSANPDRSLTVAAPKEAVDAHGDRLPEGAVARLGTVRFNHGQRLKHLLLSADGKTIYSEGGGWLRVWDAATGAERGRLATADHSFERVPDGSPAEPFLTSLVLTTDSKQIISLSQESVGVNDVVRVWDLARMKEIRKLTLPVRRLQSSLTRRNALSPNGRLAAVNLPAVMRVFDLTTGRELHKLAKSGKEINDVAFAGNARIVTADAQQIIDVWDARTGKLIRRFTHGAPAQVLATSPDGHWLATLEHHTYAIDRLLDTDRVRIWDLKTGERKHTLTARPKRWFMSIYFSPDGKRLITSSDGSQKAELTVWDVETGGRIREIDDAYGGPTAVSADGSRLVSVGNAPGKFEMWDMKNGRRLSGEDSRYSRAAAFTFSPTGDRVIILGYSSLSTWETASGRRKSASDLPPLNFYPPLSALSYDGRYALSFTGGWEKYQTFIWDIAGRRRLHTLMAPCRMGAFSSDSSLFAIWETGKQPAIRLRETVSGREVRSFPAIDVSWPFLSFTADGKTLLTASDKIVSYDVSSGKELFSWRLKPLTDNSVVDRAANGMPQGADRPRDWRGFTASPDGRQIAVTLASSFLRSRRDRIALFDARTGKLLRRWNDSGNPSSSYEKLCFSSDGQLLASTDERTIHLWETATGKEIRSFRGHRGEIEFLAFSRDDRRLASASWDSTVLIWDATGSRGRLASDAALEESWKALAGEDARRAQDAIWALARTPEKSIPFLRQRLRPVRGVSQERLDQLIKDLDSDQFAVREKAAKELRKLGELAEPALRRALQGKPSLEQRRRIEPILAERETLLFSGEILRSLRAVRVLEHAGTAEARRLLRELAGGVEGAAFTRAAQAARVRLDRRRP